MWSIHGVHVLPIRELCLDYVDWCMLSMLSVCLVYVWCSVYVYTWCLLVVRGVC